MKINLNDSTKELGISASDVEHMLKACNKYLLVEEYSPTTEEVLTLLQEARAKELSKQRRIQKWDEVISKLK